MKELSDYILDTADLDWAKLLRNWSWLLPPEFTVWFANTFGD
jgi:hypothetical protein